MSWSRFAWFGVLAGCLHGLAWAQDFPRVELKTVRLSGRVVSEGTGKPVEGFKIGVYRKAQEGEADSPWPLAVRRAGIVYVRMPFWIPEGEPIVRRRPSPVRQTIDPVSGLPIVLNDSIFESEWEFDPNYERFGGEEFADDEFGLRSFGPLDLNSLDADSHFHLIVRAKGFEPLIAGPFDLQRMPGRLVLSLKPCAGFNLSVLGVDGRPASAATVLITRWSPVRFTNSPISLERFSASGDDVARTVTDVDGRVALSSKEAEQGFLWCWNESGIAVASVESLRTAPTLRLERWSGLDVRLNEGSRPAVSNVVRLRMELPMQLDGIASPSSGSLFENDIDLKTDQTGRAHFARLPAGEANLYHGLGAGRRIAFVGFARTSLVAGVTAKVEKGGVGISVVGQVQLPTQLPAALKPSFGCFRAVPDNVGEGLRQNLLNGGMTSSRRGNEFEEIYPARISANGSFRIDGVREGRRYLLNLDFFDATVPAKEVQVFASVETSFVAEGGALNLGRLPLRYRSRSLTPGELVPPLQFVDAEGRDRSLTEFLGSHVLVVVGNPIEAGGVIIRVVNSSAQKKCHVICVGLNDSRLREAQPPLQFIRRDPRVVKATVADDTLREWMEKCSYGVGSTFILLDPYGKLVAANMHPGELHSRLSSILWPGPPQFIRPPP